MANNATSNRRHSPWWIDFRLFLPGERKPRGLERKGSRSSSVIVEWRIFCSNPRTLVVPTFGRFIEL